MWRKVLVVVCMLLLNMSVLLLFSDVFETGPHVIKALVDFGGYNSVVLLIVTAMALMLYLADVSYWKGSVGRTLRAVAVVAVLSALCALGMGLVRSSPYLPLAMFIFLLPLAALALEAAFLRGASPASSAWTVGVAFLLSAFLSLGVWMMWIYGAWGGDATGNNYWRANRAEFAADALCNATNEGFDFEVSGTYLAEDGTLVCTAAFLLWVSPFILFGVNIFVALFLLILSWSLDSNPSHSGRTGLRVLAVSAFTCMFGMYSVTSIGGAGMRLANVAMSIFFVLLLGIVVVAAGTIGWQVTLPPHHVIIMPLAALPHCTLAASPARRAASLMLPRPTLPLGSARWRRTTRLRIKGKISFGSTQLLQTWGAPFASAWAQCRLAYCSGSPSSISVSVGWESTVAASSPCRRRSASSASLQSSRATCMRYAAGSGALCSSMLTIYAC